ncbi:unnamed protein product [Linum trigynum]|uniref:Major facilitator superfamily (MFS) profile domain-containing protein n=1 Tax=Linum trigynum TaxID=586398 RepID=A0AAV2GFT5_9ROSI
MWGNIGVLADYVICNKLALSPDRITHRCLFVIPIVPSILLTIGTVVMPKSPHWLIKTRLRVDEVKQIMESDEKSTAEIDSLAFQMEHLADHIPSLRFMWKDFARLLLRRIAISATLVYSLRHFGVDAYLKLESLLALYEVDEKLLTKANKTILFVKAICAMISSRVADKAGSRFLLLLSTVLLTILFMLAFGLPLVSIHNNAAPRQVYGSSAKVLSLVAFVLGNQNSVKTACVLLLKPHRVYIEYKD